MKEKWIAALLLLLVLAIAVGIFLFSSQTGEESGGISRGLTERIFAFLGADEATAQKLHHFVRKAAHMAEFAVLGASVSMFLFYISDKGYFHAGSRRFQALWAFALAFLYAVTDEVHQYFVPGRGPSAKDVLIDSIGVMIGIALLWAADRRIHGKKKDSER